MKTILTSLFFSALLCLAPIVNATQHYGAPGNTALTNADVVKLSKVGLDDTAIIAKIRESASVNFTLETDDLVELKQGGVSSSVIKAMLERGPDTQERNTVPRAPSASAAASPVQLVSGGATMPLRSLTGHISSTYAFVSVLLWRDYAGQRAPVRTHDPKPSFVISSDQDPQSRYYIVRLDVNSKSDDRSLKMGNAKFGGYNNITAPDSDWVFAYDQVEQKRGSWSISLKKTLEPGEYGVYAALSGELFDFAIDR